MTKGLDFVYINTLNKILNHSENRRISLSEYCRKWFLRGSQEKFFIGKPWIDNQFGHLMLFSDACYLKECRAEKATEKLKIHAKHNILRSEKTLPGFFLKNIKLIHQKLGKLLTLLSL